MKIIKEVPRAPTAAVGTAFVILSAIALLATRTAVPRIRHRVDCPRLLLQSSSGKKAASDGWADTDISAASQGKLWHPHKWRTFTAARRSERPMPTTMKKPVAGMCARWAVITTIFSPTVLCKQLRALEGWCLVIVGDHKTHHKEWRSFAAAAPNTTYLGTEDQDDLGYASLDYLPYNHFGRKNVGYLYAIHHGAEVIWDTDDDNELRDPAALTTLATFAVGKRNIGLVGGEHHLWNPYPHFRPIRPATASEEEICWPRGFPLEYVKDETTAAKYMDENVSLSAANVGVFQSLADNDPDVDAVYRLTKKMPMSFLERDEMLALGHGRLAPFNAQATLWTRQSFWGLLLPVTVHGRVTDIWRSYLVQRLMIELEQHIAFTAPIVIQYRNVHSLVADLQSEVPLYTQAHELTKWLLDWKPSAKAAGRLSDRMEELMVDLYEIGVLEEEDVLLTQAWLADLEAMDYGVLTEGGKSTESHQAQPGSLPTVLKPNMKSAGKVAVCVSGQVRTLDLKLTDPDHPHEWYKMKSTLPAPNMTVAESIQRNMFSKFENPDVFMVVSTRETEREPKVGDLSVCEPLRPEGGNLYCSVRKEQEVPIFNSSMWVSFDLYQKTVKNREPFMRGLLQQLKGMFDCHTMIQEHSRKTGQQYDWIVRLRPDDYIYSFPSLERLALDAARPTVWYGNKEVCCCGNEDRFGIASAKWMHDYFERFLYLQQVPWDYMWKWNSEKFLEHHLKERGIELKAHPDMHLCVVKPAYRHGRSLP